MPDVAAETKERLRVRGGFDHLSAAVASFSACVAAPNRAARSAISDCVSFASPLFIASRTDFDSPWIKWAADSIHKTTGSVPAVLPNFGGSLPNDVFSETLGLPTIWVPHSYPGCSQHAPDEHILLSVTEEALGIMAGLFWDLGERAQQS